MPTKSNEKQHTNKSKRFRAHYCKEKDCTFIEKFCSPERDVFKTARQCLAPDASCNYGDWVTDIIKINMILFPDSNVFIHFKPIENWTRKKNDDPFQVGLCLCIINELDKIKYSANTTNIKRRVQGLVKKLSAPPPLVINNIPFIIYMPDELQMILDKSTFDKNDKDDVFIATVIKYSQDHPTEQIKIISNDLGVQLKCKAHYINFIVPSEEYLIQEEDIAEKEIRHLKTELNRVKNLQPKLRMQFDNGESHIKFDIEEPCKENENEIMEIMDRIKQANPLLELDPYANPSIFSLGLYQKTPEKVDEYNAAMSQFYSDYEIYFRRSKIYSYKDNLTVILNIEISNNGNTPAENIDLYMHFPDGFTLCEKDDYHEKELEPTPPNLSSFSMAPPDFYGFMRTMAVPTFPDINLGGFSIKKTNSYDVNDHFNIIKHNHSAKVYPLYVTFDSYIDVMNFEISYRITAANMVDIVDGKLHVVINKIVNTNNEE
ncbi:MAG: PIN domain-containing protein [Bacteroidota bacterium]